MRTGPTEQQFAEPEVAEPNRVLETCVHYGFCTSTCPTYVLPYDENESPRGRIDLRVLCFNREDADERRRADACYRAMAEQVAARGAFVGRAPIDYHGFHMQQTVPAFRNACSAIKRALDPNGIIAPGRYGIE